MPRFAAKKLPHRSMQSFAPAAWALQRCASLRRAQPVRRLSSSAARFSFLDGRCTRSWGVETSMEFGWSRELACAWPCALGLEMPCLEGGWSINQCFPGEMCGSSIPWGRYKRVTRPVRQTWSLWDQRLRDLVKSQFTASTILSSSLVYLPAQ